MPIIDGKVVRSRYTKLDLHELSSVDNPAQPGALASIMKRHTPIQKAQPSLLAMAVAKYVDEEDGAHTFVEVLQANAFDEKIWPMTSALSQAIRSIMGDTSIAAADRETKVTQSVDEFLASVRDISPTAEKRLAELISKKDSTMKTIAELTAEVEALTGKCTALTGEVTTLKADVADKDAKLKAAMEDKDKADKALLVATDETLKVEGNDVKKSEVGAASFAVFKSLNDRAETAECAKRAADEFGHVVGTTAEKALVIKALNTMPEDAQKALTAILTSAEKMAAGGFSRLGAGNDDNPDVRKSIQTFEGKVAEIEKRDGVAKHLAMSKARTEFPDEFKAYQDAKAAA